MAMTREEEAQKAYVKLLTGQGVSQRVLVQREFIIIRLSAFLKDIPCDGTHYRQAVDRFIGSIDAAEIPTVLPVIREFFSFWLGDIKAIAAMSQAKVFHGSPATPTLTQDELFKQWYELDKTPLQAQEQQIFDTFAAAASTQHSDENTLKERLRMAKFLLVSLRPVSYKQSYSYRQTVDRNLPLFTAIGIQHAFLSLSREFYAFWRGESVNMPTDKVHVLRPRDFAIAA